MDRRTFLQTLASLGFAVAMPFTLAVATSMQVDVAWVVASSEAWDVLKVEEAKTRYEACGFSRTRPSMRRDVFIHSILTARVLAEWLSVLFEEETAMRGEQRTATHYKIHTHCSPMPLSLPKVL